MPRRIIDLTYSIHEGITTYPRYWHPKVEITQLGRLDIEGRETRRIVLGTHTGTHCDAPRHFIEGGQTIDLVPLDILIGPAVVLDFSKKGPLQEIAVSDFEEHLGNNIPERLVLRFEWSDYWNTSEYYKNHPFISIEAAQWLVGKGIRLLAMDTPTPDRPSNIKDTAKDSPIHKILLGKGIVLVEYLCNLKELNQRVIELIILPLKIVDGDGSPARCIAIEEDVNT